MDIRRVVVVVGLALGGTTTTTTACSSSEGSDAIRVDPGPTPDAASACVPGQQTACACPGGGSGVQVCDTGGASFRGCECTTDERDGGADAGDAGYEDAGADAPPPTVIVAFQWSYVSIGGGGQCTGAISCAACPGLTECTCAGGSAAVRPAFCCSASATIVEADLSTLVQDYPACTLEQTSPTTYALSCAAPSAKYDGVTQVEGIPHINQCTWSLPYAVP